MLQIPSIISATISLGQFRLLQGVFNVIYPDTIVISGHPRHFRNVEENDTTDRNLIAETFTALADALQDTYEFYASKLSFD